MEGFNIIHISREKQKSEYDWFDIEYNDSRVGKSRCLIDNDELVIFSINIYPEYQNNGFGSMFVDSAKHQFSKIIADKVRFNAIAFWEKMGFNRAGISNNWNYKNHKTIFSK